MEVFDEAQSAAEELAADEQPANEDGASVERGEVEKTESRLDGQLGKASLRSKETLASSAERREKLFVEGHQAYERLKQEFQNSPQADTSSFELFLIQRIESGQDDKSPSDILPKESSPELVERLRDPILALAIESSKNPSDHSRDYMGSIARFADGQFFDMPIGDEGDSITIGEFVASSIALDTGVNIPSTEQSQIDAVIRSQIMSRRGTEHELRYEDIFSDSQRRDNTALGLWLGAAVGIAPQKDVVAVATDAVAREELFSNAALVEDSVRVVSELVKAHPEISPHLQEAILRKIDYLGMSVEDDTAAIMHGPLRELLPVADDALGYFSKLGGLTEQEQEELTSYALMQLVERRAGSSDKEIEIDRAIIRYLDHKQDQAMRKIPEYWKEDRTKKFRYDKSFTPDAVAQLLQSRPSLTEALVREHDTSILPYLPVEAIEASVPECRVFHEILEVAQPETRVSLLSSAISEIGKYRASQGTGGKSLSGETMRAHLGADGRLSEVKLLDESSLLGAEEFEFDIVPNEEQADDASNDELLRALEPALCEVLHGHHSDDENRALANFVLQKCKNPSVQQALQWSEAWRSVPRDYLIEKAPYVEQLGDLIYEHGFYGNALSAADQCGIMFYGDDTPEVVTRKIYDRIIKMTLTSSSEWIVRHEGEAQAQKVSELICANQHLVDLVASGDCGDAVALLPMGVIKKQLPHFESPIFEQVLNTASEVPEATNALLRIVRSNSGIDEGAMLERLTKECIDFSRIYSGYSDYSERKRFDAINGVIADIVSQDTASLRQLFMADLTFLQEQGLLNAIPEKQFILAYPELQGISYALFSEQDGANADLLHVVSEGLRNGDGMSDIEKAVRTEFLDSQIVDPELFNQHPELKQALLSAESAIADYDPEKLAEIFPEIKPYESILQCIMPLYRRTIIEYARKNPGLSPTELFCRCMIDTNAEDIELSESELSSGQSLEEEQSDMLSRMLCVAVLQNPSLQNLSEDCPELYPQIEKKYRFCMLRELLRTGATAEATDLEYNKALFDKMPLSEASKELYARFCDLPEEKRCRIKDIFEAFDCDSEKVVKYLDNSGNLVFEKLLADKQYWLCFEGKDSYGDYPLDESGNFLDQEKAQSWKPGFKALLLQTQRFNQQQRELFAKYLREPLPDGNGTRVSLIDSLGDNDTNPIKSILTRKQRICLALCLLRTENNGNIDAEDIEKLSQRAFRDDGTPNAVFDLAVYRFRTNQDWPGDDEWPLVEDFDNDDDQLDDGELDIDWEHDEFGDGADADHFGLEEEEEADGLVGDGESFEEKLDEIFSMLLSPQERNMIRAVENESIFSEQEINRDNVLLALMVFLHRDVEDWDSATDTELMVKDAFSQENGNSVKNLATSEIRKWYEALLRDGDPEARFVIQELFQEMKDDDGAGPLVQIESILKYLGAFSEHRDQLAEPVLALEKRMQEQHWSNDTRTNFYDVASEIIEVDPSLFEEFAEVLRDFPDSQSFDRFAKDIMPLYRAKLALMRKHDYSGDSVGHGFTSYDYSDLDIPTLREQLHQITLPFRSLKNPDLISRGIARARGVLLGEVSDALRTKFGLLDSSIPENLSSRDVRVMEDIALYNSYMQDHTPEKQAILSYILALQLRQDGEGWDQVRRGDIIPPEELLTEDFAKVVRSALSTSEENSPFAIADRFGVRKSEIGRFRTAAQAELSTRRRGATEMLEGKIERVVGGLGELSDPDYYADMSAAEKDKFALVSRYSDQIEMMGLAAAILWQEASGRPRDQKTQQKIEALTNSGLGDLDAIEQDMRALIERHREEFSRGPNGETLSEAQIINTQLQSGLSSLKLQFILARELHDDEFITARRELRESTTAGPEIMELFGRMQAEYPPENAPCEIIRDALDDFLSEYQRKLTPEEQQLIRRRREEIDSKMDALNGRYAAIMARYSKFKAQVGRSSQAVQAAFAAKFEEIDEIIEKSNKETVITTTMTTDFVTMMENIRACLSCKTKGCNNDTDLTFLEPYKFYLYSASGASRESSSSISDEIVHLLPHKEGDQSSLCFVMDLIYGMKNTDILLSHLQTVYEKARSLKQQFPDVRLSIMIPSATISSVASSADGEVFARTLGIDAERVRSADGTVFQPESAFADHYVEYGSANDDARRAGNKAVQGYEIII